MKKTFSLIDPKKKPERVADKIKHEVKKYIKRERNKELPSTVDFWDFGCRIGVDEESAVEIELTDVNMNISKMVTDEVEKFYLEILSKPGSKEAIVKKKAAAKELLRQQAETLEKQAFQK